MIYLGILVIVCLIGAVVFYLINDRNAAKALLEEIRIKEKYREWDDKILGGQKNVEESERDYHKAVEDFYNNDDDTSGGAS